MFETVVPEAVAPRSRRLLYGTLPVSLGIHAILGAAAVAGALWKVEFPKQSPKMFMTYSLIEPPPLPPPPPPPPAPKRAAVPVVEPRPNAPLVAPPFIPDEIPVVEPHTAAVEEAPVTGGVEGGVEGGIEGGIVGGIVDSVLADVAPPPPPPKSETVTVKRDEPLPMPAVAQEYPVYPEYARTRGWEDSMVVRYIIDKTGRVREVTVLTPPAREEFRRETVSAIRRWRFKPFRDESGELKEVSHELTVDFRIVRK